jgi:uncharacterized membrane protein
MGISKHIKKTVFTGLFILIPLVATLYVIYVVVAFVDGLIGPAVKNLLFTVTGRDIYIPGTGLILFALLAYATGVAASNYAGKRLLAAGEKVLRRIPFVKGIYNSVKDLTEAFSSEKKRSFQDVVLVDFPFKGRYAIGFVVNRRTIKDEKPFCAVFIPTTPNPTSGYLIMVPEQELVFIDMAVDDALKYIVSIGTSGQDKVWTGIPSD